MVFGMYDGRSGRKWGVVLFRLMLGHLGKKKIEMAKKTCAQLLHAHSQCEDVPRLEISRNLVSQERRYITVF